LKKATAAASVSKTLMGGAAPQARGDPNNIRVGVRCRPLSGSEKEQHEEVIVKFSGNSICLVNPAPAAGESGENIFAYDHLYEMDSESATVFEDMGKPLIEGLMEGFNCTLFAYGQTGSGKTFSMMGIPSKPGVIPLAAMDIFERRSALLGSLGEGATVKVFASYLQIYREVLQDLLGPDASADLKIRRDPKLGTYVQGLSESIIEDATALTDIIDRGNKRRAVAKTNMNSESSRSHAVVIIRLEQEHPGAMGRGKKRIASKINLVDLAGSERSSKTGATGEVLKEAIAINQSLSALGNVINALTDPVNKGHIPYRSSKLTHLLEESLGGNSQTTMLAAISPAGKNFSETFQTLQYATRAKLIVTNAKANAFSEQLKPSAFGAAQAEQMQAEMAASMAASMAAEKASMAAQQAELQASMQAAQAAQAAQLESQIAALRQASNDELSRLQADHVRMMAELGEAKAALVAALTLTLTLTLTELGEAKAALAAAHAIGEVHAGQVDAERRRADEAERRRAGAAEEAQMALAHARREAAEVAARAEAARAEADQGKMYAREVEALKIELEAMRKENERAVAEKERVAVDSLEGQVVKAQQAEELRQMEGELHAAEVKMASSEERVAGLERTLDQTRAQLRTTESQRDQAWAREKLLEEQRVAADAHARSNAEQYTHAQQQLQAALAAQVEMQRAASEQASAVEAAEMAGGLAEVQKALVRLEARQVEQAEAAVHSTSKMSAEQGEELARLDQLLQTQAAQHASAIEILERRAAAEASRLADAGKLAAEQAAIQLAQVQTRLREEQEARVRLHSENTTRKAAADALGERVAMLEEHLNSSKLDAEVERHGARADKAELEEALRAKGEEVEAMRLAVLQHQHEAESMRMQMRERDESLARRAERLRQLQALYERALQDKQRVEEAAWAERQELHDERRALELRIREEAGRARQAIETVERAKTNPSMLERLFNQIVVSPSQAKELVRHDAREAWAEQPAPIALTDSARMPYQDVYAGMPIAVPNGGNSGGASRSTEASSSTPTPPAC